MMGETDRFVRSRHMADAKETAKEPQADYDDGRSPGKKAMKRSEVVGELYSIVVADRIMSKLAQSGSTASRWRITTPTSTSGCTRR